MIERIYDTLKAIIWTDFPKDCNGFPMVYDRKVESWYFGDRDILASPLGIVITKPSANIKDIGYGLRLIDYSVGIMVYSSNDDKETSDRIVQEAARIVHSILKNHRSIWVCELCPFCEKLPLSPIHYIDNGVVTAIGVNTALIPPGQSSYLIHLHGNPTGFGATAYIRLSQGISGKVTNAEILSCGLAITNTSYLDSFANLNITLSSGSGHTSSLQSVFEGYVTDTVNRINTYWSETHDSGTPQYLDWAGVSYQALQALVSDWNAGFKPATITANTKWNANMNALSSNFSEAARLLQDVQVSSINLSDDGRGAAFLHQAEFTLSAKEIVSVDQFGPNNVDVNAV